MYAKIWISSFFSSKCFVESNSTATFIRTGSPGEFLSFLTFTSQVSGGSDNAARKHRCPCQYSGKTHWNQIFNGTTCTNNVIAHREIFIINVLKWWGIPPFNGWSVIVGIVCSIKLKHSQPANTLSWKHTNKEREREREREKERERERERDRERERELHLALQWWAWKYGPQNVPPAIKGLEIRAWKCARPE